MPSTEPIVLNAAQARVLGALMEKETTTPDYYPLSLNALANACNQRSNREPVMDLTEDEVRDALAGLQQHRLAGPARGKRRQPGDEIRALAWRGFQFQSGGDCSVVRAFAAWAADARRTGAGARSASTNLWRLAMCWADCRRLMERTPALVAVLARQPGTKESRYAHLLSGEVSAARWLLRRKRPPKDRSVLEERIVQLESNVRPRCGTNSLRSEREV